ncbi:acidic leucine-rich nuclear phosphoprotein 32 family member B-like isoform X3 [Phycodurus eques]|uniref:acidic leucine-rich nuclear phosphoprotein 32 family member B-like isoform X3 n=1 Tax=Phycodurus eques TaxID=693459 RepID=UPI002ACD48C8|nr:acidic leucine-rich nuclear phosphoprotein 32 family member B-like isoform X3 [Phycodurus eques]
MCARRVKEEECEEEFCKRRQHGAADVREEDLRPEKREPETPHVKDEEQQDEISRFPSTGVALKDEDDDGDRWGGSQAEDLSAPLSERDDVTSHSSDYDEAEADEDEDDDDDDDKDEHAKGQTRLALAWLAS